MQEGVRLHEHKGRSYIVARIVMQPGAELSEHAHDEEQMFYIMSGRLRYRVNGEDILAGPGDAIVVPANAPHWGCVEGEEEAVFIEVKERISEQHKAS